MAQGSLVIHVPGQTVPKSETANSDSRRRPRVLILNRSYWPDAEATGQFLTELCEDLAQQFDITVVAGQPNQNPDALAFRRTGREVHQGVMIRRVWNCRFAKASLPGRVINLLSYLAAALLAGLRVPRPDVVVVESDPPLLCFLGAILQRWHRTCLVVYLQDIYPDLAVALGKLPDRRWVRVLRAAMGRTYRGADRVVVPSRDMQAHLASFGVPDEKICPIPNWVDLRLVYPRKSENRFRAAHGLDGRFVVMYSGNLGLCQRLEDVLEAATLLRDRGDVAFVLVGDGVLRNNLQETARQRSLTNVRFLPYQPKRELAESLSAADLHLLPLDPRVVACVMPSKIYGILASGSPVAVIAPQECQLAEEVRRWNVGLIVPPEQPRALAEAICAAVDRREDLAAMGRHAREVAEEEHSRACRTAQFAAMLWSVLQSASAQAVSP